MFTLGIPNRQYRRTTKLLGPHNANPLQYDVMDQGDGFYVFSFDVDYDGFLDIVMMLKRNGVTTIGADTQLTENKIMKLTEIYKSLDDKPLNEQFKEKEVEIEVPDLEGKTKVKIRYKDVTDDDALKDVRIIIGSEVYSDLNFEVDDDIEGEDFGNEGKLLIFKAESTFKDFSEEKDVEFRVDVNVEADYENSGNIQEIDWDTLEVKFIKEGTMSDDEVDRAITIDAPEPGSLQERFKKLANIIK